MHSSTEMSSSGNTSTGLNSPGTSVYNDVHKRCHLNSSGNGYGGSFNPSEKDLCGASPVAVVIVLSASPISVLLTDVTV